MEFKPFIGGQSGTEFYVPPHIQTDFENYLDTDVPNANFTFEIISDWPSKRVAGYTPRYLRAEMYPINWKSNFGNADNTMNFKTDLRVPVNKGDIVIRPDGQIRLLNWKVEKHVNDQSTQAQECNTMLTITRRSDDIVNPSTGMLVTAGSKVKIVDAQPSSIYQYDGRPYYDVNNAAPGVAPDVVTMAQLQWNTETRNIRVGDEFNWIVDSYRIINIDYSGIDIGLVHGVVRFHAKKIAGGAIG